MLYTNIVKC